MIHNSKFISLNSWVIMWVFFVAIKRSCLLLRVHLSLPGALMTFLAVLAQDRRQLHSQVFEAPLAVSCLLFRGWICFGLRPQRALLAVTMPCACWTFSCNPVLTRTTRKISKSMILASVPGCGGPFLRISKTRVQGLCLLSVQTRRTAGRRFTHYPLSRT